MVELNISVRYSEVRLILDRADRIITSNTATEKSVQIEFNAESSREYLSKASITSRAARLSLI